MCVWPLVEGTSEKAVPLPPGLESPEEMSSANTIAQCFAEIRYETYENKH